MTDLRFAGLARNWLARSAGIALLAVLPALADAAALEQFKSFVASTKSARGEFTQRQVSTNGDKARVSNPASGTFIFARPGKFIWTYKQPYEQVLQADGQKLYIYDRDLNQVTVRKLGSALGSSPAAILFGSNDLEKNFTLKEGGAKDGLEWLEATPKAKDTTFDKIGIGMRNGVPEAMELRDSFGQVSLLTFTKFQKNPPMKLSQFRFVAPKGADVFQN
jgi:outer membrane lipoprotein carrier protein